MTASVARDSHPSAADHEPMSLVRVRAKAPRTLSVRAKADAFRSTLVDPTFAALQKPAPSKALDGLLEAGFADCIIETGAHVGLIHRRGDAFFFTIDVHGLDRGMHMLVWVSMWDAAIQAMLRGHSLTGASQANAENATVARRLTGTSEPTSILAVPVTIGTTVEAVVELGRFGRTFASGSDLLVLEAMQHMVSRAA